ncbi:MAG TPA: hypothetical protein VG826_05050 [Pirellulales bacterium]|nr:hypothetical protein [Pirellulales bacterium]
MAEDLLLKGIPVILLDSEKGVTRPQGALPTSVVGRLTKPFDAELLFESVFLASDYKRLLGRGEAILSDVECVRWSNDPDGRDCE